MYEKNRFRYILRLAMYHGPNNNEKIFPAPKDEREFAAGKEIIPHHPNGKFIAETRKNYSQIGDISSDTTFYLFSPLSIEQLETLVEKLNPHAVVAK